MLAVNYGNDQHLSTNLRGNIAAFRSDDTQEVAALRMRDRLESWMVGLAQKWVRLAPNGTNPGLFQIRFQCNEI